MATFQLINIPLSTRDGKDQFPAQVYGEIVAPGLAITPDLGGCIDDASIQYAGGFMLTHLPSGRNATGTVQGGQCIACIRDYTAAAIESGIDWTQSMDALTALIKAGGPGMDVIRKAQRELFGCGGTDCREVDGF